MTEKKWILNSSPVITFGKLERISLLEEMCDEMVIPKGVAYEISQGTEDDPAKQWIESDGKKHITDIGSVKPIVSAWDIGLGESEVISWCYEHRDYTAIIDDRAAKNCALSLSVKVRGTIGIILLAKQMNKIDQASQLLNRLPLIGFRIKPDILRAAMKLTNEQ
ncbi:MAG: DUF3368 domain-containing protein [Deltaproteobacteria bacterium]|nr:MAG: DUF3368 domain-containing protein [Deltaproteobacteria bacterium]